MPKEDQEILQSGLSPNFNFDDLKDTINKVRLTAESGRWRIVTPSGEINFGQTFDKLVSWVQKFAAIGDTIATYDPGHAALPLAAMRFVLQVSRIQFPVKCCIENSL